MNDVTSIPVDFFQSRRDLYHEQANRWIDRFDIPRNGQGDVWGPGHNDAADAFRHAYVTGKFAQDFGFIRAYNLGAIHEAEGLRDKFPKSSDSQFEQFRRETVMDNHSNQYGANAGVKIDTGEGLADDIKSGIDRGDLITTPDDLSNASWLARINTWTQEQYAKSASRLEDWFRALLHEAPDGRTSPFPT